MITLARSTDVDQQRKGPLYSAQAIGPVTASPSIGAQLTDKVLDKAIDKVGTETIGAMGAAMGDPTGGMATEAAAEVALPMLKDLLGNLFNKGGYVNGPLSMQNISKVKYKQSGGKVAEEIEVNYGGPLSVKGV